MNAALKAQDPFLYATLFDLTRKNFLPTNFNPYDPSIFTALSKNVQLEPFKEHICQTCGITFYGAKKLLLEHSKVHNSQKEIKENEYNSTNWHEFY